MAASKTVTFITDPEGNLDYFNNCVRLAEGLDYEEDALTLREGSILVFGGDICDKGPGTLRLCKLILTLKKKFPDRVFMLVGNRDLNKMRILTELTPAALSSPPRMPYGAPLNTKTYEDFLHKIALDAKTAEVVEGVPLPAAVMQSLDTKANRLRWMLDCTYGAQGDFEMRRTELHLMRFSGMSTFTLWKGGAVSDDDVVKSYEDSMKPGGVMLEYLKDAQLALKIDETLYVHGGVICSTYSGNAANKFVDSPLNYTGDIVADGEFESCMGVVPGCAGRIEDFDEWVSKLNAWMQDEVAACVASPEGVCAEQYCTYGTWPSVIMSRHLNARSQPTVFPERFAAQLNAAGVRRVVVGHTPHGNCPTVIPGAVELVMADTSFSNFAAPDKRGDAASIVEVTGPVLRVWGLLEDRTPIRYTMGCPEADPHIGTGKFDSWWVKAKLEEKNEYLLCHVDGFKYEYKRVAAADLAGSL